MKIIFKGKVILAILLVIVVITANNNIFARLYPKDCEGGKLPVSYIDDKFPTSYIPYLNELKKNFPNWKFKAVHTNLDFNLVVSHETYEKNVSISTVHENYDEPYKYKKDGKFVYVDGPFVCASKEAVMYTLDPRNYLTREKIFQFEDGAYNDTVASLDTIKKIILNTPMTTYSNKYQGKENDKVVLKDMDKTYAEYILEYSKKNNVNPIHVASRILQETRCDIINNPSIFGIRSGYENLYNYFNIGSTPNKDGSGAVENGLKYARKNNWINPMNAIDGGTKYLSNKWIKWGQNTMYFQKFDVNNPGQAQFLFGSQYMTNILAPNSESITTYKGYLKSSRIDLPFEFHIPVYENMPEYPCEEPHFKDDYINDNTKVYLDDKIANGTDTFNFRTTPDTSSYANNIIKKLTETKDGKENRKIYTRIAKGNGSGFDRIKLDDGMIGYIKSEYVNEYNYIKATSIKLNKNNLDLAVNDKFKFEVKTEPTNATFKDVIYSSSDDNIASVDKDGNLIAKKEGICIITALNKIDNVKDICNVKVVKDSIKFNKDEYVIYTGLNNLIVPVISNSDTKECVLSVSDDKIIKLDNNKVVGLKEGKANLIATIKGTNIKKEVKIIVKEAKGTEVIFYDSLNVENKYINKIKLNEKVSSVKNKFSTKLNVTFKNNKGIELKDDDILGTGTKIIFTNDKGFKDEYKVYLYGDLSGDGKINSLDLLNLRLHLIEKELLKDEFLKASNISKKDEKINSLDLLMLREHLIEKNIIEQ